MWLNTCEDGISSVCTLAHLVVCSEAEVMLWEPSVCYLRNLCVLPEQQSDVVFQCLLPFVHFLAAICLYPITVVNLQFCVKLAHVPQLNIRLDCASLYRKVLFNNITKDYLGSSIYIVWVKLKKCVYGRQFCH